MELEEMKTKHALMEAKLTLHEEKMERMSDDIREIKHSIVSMSDSFSQFSNYITGKKAVVGFIIGVGTVIAGVIGAGVGIIQMFKFFTGHL